METCSKDAEVERLTERRGREAVRKQGADIKGGKVSEQSPAMIRRARTHGIFFSSPGKSERKRERREEEEGKNPSSSCSAMKPNEEKS